MVNLYNEKTAITAAHLLNAFVVPWYNAQEIELIRMLTDRGTEYCGKAEQHAYQLFLAIEDIEHTKTQVRSPQTNGKRASTHSANFRTSMCGKKLRCLTVNCVAAERPATLKARYRSQ